jgi:4-hydroxybenzoate polyprenyltransferase
MQSTSSVKIIVSDLDGTILRTDLLIEQLHEFILLKPYNFILVLIWLSRGLVYLKAKLASLTKINLNKLPFNSEVVSFLTEKNKEGYVIAIATGSHEIIVNKLSSYLPFENIIYATGSSTKNTNLIGKNKELKLNSIYGSQNYSYIGNSNDDLYVWRSCSGIYVVNPSRMLSIKLKKISKTYHVFKDGRNRSMVTSYLRLIRPHQWIKNTLIFVPIIAAHALHLNQTFFNVVTAFILFCFTASSVYVLNDIIDIRYDREHETKKNRPIANGDISIINGVIFLIALTLTVIYAGYFLLGAEFLFLQIFYILLSSLYSICLKKIVIVDLIALSFLYTFRIYVGTIVAATPISYWLLTFSSFVFLSLAAAKRYIEVKKMELFVGDNNFFGRKYERGDSTFLSILGITTSGISLLVFTLFIQEAVLLNRYANPFLLYIICVLIGFYVFRIWLFALRLQLDDDPILFAAKDKISWILAICILITMSRVI